MKESYIYIGAPVLAAALRRVKPAISRQWPIMQNVMITRRAVIAGNLDAWFMAEIDAGGYGAFKVAVEPAPLLKALKGVKGMVTLHDQGGRVKPAALLFSGGDAINIKWPAMQRKSENRKWRRLA